MVNKLQFTNFKFWCQKVLPAIYDDSLSYYELLCKLVNQLNDVMQETESAFNQLVDEESNFEISITTQWSQYQSNLNDAWEDYKETTDEDLANYKNNLNSEWNNVQQAWNQLREFVNNYFDNLDVQEEINNKLDEMSQDGSLSALIQPLFDSYKMEINPIIETQNNKISVLEGRMDTFSHLAQGSTTGDAELMDIRVGANGVTYETAGDAVREQITDVNNDLLKTFSNSSYLDFNTAPINSKIVYTSSANIENAPVQKSGTLITYCSTKNNTTQVQVYVTSDNEFYFRRCWGGTWRTWRNINSLTESDLIISYNATTTYYDFNNAPVNSKIVYTNATNIVNAPVQESGTLLTYCSSQSEYTPVQLYVTISNKLYFRRKWNVTWRDWETVNTVSNDEIVVSYPSSGNLDFNEVPVNSKIVYLNSTGIVNYPVKKSGSLLTYCSTKNDSTPFQIYSTSDGDTFIRRKWGDNWRAWKQIEDKSHSLRYNGNILSMYDNLVFCGDSLTRSLVYTSSNSSRVAKRTYPQVVSSLCGNNQTTYATGGYTASDWWNRYKNNLVTLNNGLYVIYLGTNDGLTDTIATDCPVGESVDNYANTHTGNYGKILKTIYDLGEKAILIKIYYTNADVNATNSVIEQFGERFGFPVIDNEKFVENCYHYYPDGTGTNSLHYNDLGYARFGNYVVNEVSNLSELMLERLSKFNY